MAEQYTKPYEAQASYGGSAVSNRVRPGGTLGSNQYYYTTNAKTGEISVYKWQPDQGSTVSGSGEGLKIGSLKQGETAFYVSQSDSGTFLASDAERKFYADKLNIGKVRSQALQTARKEWDGRTQPPPTQAIYGTNAINAAYDPAGSVTKANSLKNNTSAAQNPKNNPSATDGTGSSPANTGLTPKMGDKGKRNKGGSASGLVYPSAIRTSEQDYITIQQLKYKPSAMAGGSQFGWDTSGRLKDRELLGGPIILPIPGGIADSNNVSWGQDKMSAAETALANIADETISEGGQAGVDAAVNIAAQVTGEGAADTKEALKKQLAGMASGTGAQLLTRTTGNIMNPNMELLFKDPSLRQFNFTWKLSARSKKEAQTIIKIISTFKKGMAPTKSDSNLFLQSPNTWKLTYMNRGNPHKYLNKFKECAMTSFNVTYTPDGNYSTFEDGVMTAYQISMGLQELEPVFSNDYGTESEIGF